jgi:hypothetical protein
MAFLRTFVRSVALVGLVAASGEAQTRRAHVVAAPQGRPRIASIAPPPAPQGPFTYGETVFATYPVIVLPDGRVLVDLGNGYEQVARTCPYAYGYACQSNGYPVAPQTPLFNGYIPPRYAPPAYGAQPYPVPTYPSGGYGNYPGYAPPQYSPPPSYGACPAGYIATGSYPPCIDPSLSPGASASIPSAGAVRAAPRRAPGPTPTVGRVVRR